MIAKHLPRVLIYGILLIAAFFFLAPLYVMLVTSFKDAAQIRSGNLMSLRSTLSHGVWRGPRLAPGSIAGASSPTS